MGTERPAKRVKLLSDDDASGSESETSGGVPVTLGFNEEYARRFEHNKKRAEQHRLEEKYGRNAAADDDEEDSDESTDEEEDEDAELANGALDEEFQTALKALKNKDPVIYDNKHKFYSTDPDAEAETEVIKRDKPLHLVDYQRQRLLNGDIGGDDEDGPNQRQTYAGEQEALRKSFINGAATADGGDVSMDEDDSEGENGFLTRKTVVRPEGGAAKVDVLTEEIRTKAADDPDRFLSTFMANKGWVANPGSKLQAFESDDEDFDDIQDEFEHKYNMRFENQDTKGKIQTFARDMASQQSVRKESLTQRQRVREAERQRKEEEKQERAQERARLRKLKLDEAEEKLRMVKKAAGTKGEDFDMEQWSALLTGDYDEKWQQKFEENFGDGYYAEQDHISDDGDDGSDDDTTEKKQKKPRKPKFEDDIDITDLVPDFDEEQTFSITDDEENGHDDNEEAVTETKKKKKSSKDIKKAKEEAKREARKERRKLEAIVDEKLEMESALGKAEKPKTGLAPFRYRETSPTSFGLTPSEILMASDTQLNEFVGIKKLASFRDDAKKKKDRKHLGKKARLRKWRQETFGNESGPTKTIQDVMKEAEE